MPPQQPTSTITVRCDGVIDPFTGAVEVRAVDCERMPEMEAILRARLQSLRRWSFSVRKIGILSALVVSATILAAGYGALHNQLSWTLAPEYFTKIKFPQLGLDAAVTQGLLTPRAGAALVGAICSWWVGAGAALFLGLVGMIHPERVMFRRTFRALLLVMGVAVIFGFLGLGLGELSALFTAWAPPRVIGYDHLPQVRAVGCMHDGSYLGGALGLAIAWVDLRRIPRFVRESHTPV